jgi:hypothetical protein
LKKPKVKSFDWLDFEEAQIKIASQHCKLPNLSSNKVSSWPFGNLIFIVGISFIDLVSSKVIVGTPVKSNKDFIKIYTYVVSNISY